MGMEIERKFLVKKELWTAPDNGTVLRQGYMRFSSGTVRVRTAGTKAFLTVKGRVSGISRHEFEYEIPFRDAAEMLDSLCEKPLIEKTRYIVEHDGNTWEVDDFHGDNAGLLMAEIELESEDQTFSLPSWTDREVSGDFRYYNSYLCGNPYCSWKDTE